LKLLVPAPKWAGTVGQNISRVLYYKSSVRNTTSVVALIDGPGGAAGLSTIDDAFVVATHEGFDETVIGLLAAARNEVLLYDVSTWGEDVGLASRGWSRGLLSSPVVRSAMTVGTVGSGPAVAAVEAALSDVATGVSSIELSEMAAADVSVVVGQAGDVRFERANEQALENGLRWLAIELGGVGGVPVVDAAVAAFGPETACYECLSERVGANLDPEADPSAAPPAHTARFAGAVAGREVARHVTDGTDVFGRVLEPPRTQRELLPVPHCVCDRGIDRTIGRDFADRELEDSLARAERAVDDRLGVVQEIGEAESFPVPYYLSQLCDTEGFSDAAADRQAAGVAPGWDVAFMKALGEGLERYAAGVYRAETLPVGRPDEVDNAVPPSAFVCRDEPTVTEPIRWVPGEDLQTGERVHLPAAFVFHPPPAERFRPSVTTGLGLENSTVGAILAGLSEVVERDAAMLSWYSTFEPLAVEISDKTIGTLRARARSENLSVTLLLLTQDIDVPVIAAAVHRDEWPRLALGSGASLDVAAAARSALAEALQNWVELREMGPERADQAGGAIGEYASFPPTVESFVGGETTIPAASLRGEEMPEGEAALGAMIERLDAAGLSAYAARTTTRDVAALGFEAVRVLVPGAQPLFLTEPYFGDRAETVPEELGFEPRPGRDHHPFP
jgi:ribosomal protein S12 methylthiotransferase accessory factor